MTDRKCLVAYDVCGCTGWVSVLGYGDDAEAFRKAARFVKRGFRVEQLAVAVWREGPGWHCDDHPDGPPWWKGNGGNGKRPAEYAPQTEMFR